MPKLTHAQITQLVNCFFPTVGLEGVCDGFTAMWIQTEMLCDPNEQLRFFKRLDYIHQYYVKNDALDVEKIRQDLAAAQQKVKSKKQLTDKDEQILQIRAFIDGIGLQQKSINYSPVFNDKFVPQHEKDTIYPFTFSKMLEDSIKKGEIHITILPSMPLILTKDQYIDFFENLNSLLKERISWPNRICFTIGIHGHSIGLSNIPSESKWKLMDVNISGKNKNFYFFDSLQLVDFLFTNYHADSLPERDYCYISLAVISPNKDLAQEIKDMTSSRVIIPDNLYARSELLFHACMEGHIDIVNKLVEKNIVDINWQNPKMNFGTPLIAACQNGYLPIVQKLLNKGADPNILSKGTTPLQSASLWGHLDIVKELLKKGANVNEQNQVGATALLYSSMQGNYEIVEELVKKGASVNLKMVAGMTPLHFACGHGHVEVVKILLKAGANPFQPNHAGETPFQLASQEKHTKVIQAILQDTKPQYRPLSLRPLPPIPVKRADKTTARPLTARPTQAKTPNPKTLKPKN